MEMKKRIRSVSILALTCLLVLLYLSRAQVIWAAGGVDVNKSDCSLTVAIDDSEFLKVFGDDTINVSVYRVADMDISARFTATENFKNMKFDDISEASTADDWQKKTKEAKGYLKGLQPDSTVQLKKNEGGTEISGILTGLKTGLYLVVADPILNQDGSKRFEFASYLTAVPTNNYAMVGENKDYGNGTDEWVYNPRIVLKVQQGLDSLKITKKLLNYNETLGPVSFAFRIVGWSDANKVNKIYDNYIKIDMDSTETQTVTIKDLPAGMWVSVEEEYTGASYELVEKSPKDNVIKMGFGGTTEVIFTNDYNGGNHGGNGITNHFYDSDGNGGWKYEKIGVQAQN